MFFHTCNKKNSSLQSHMRDLQAAILSLIPQERVAAVLPTRDHFVVVRVEPAPFPHDAAQIPDVRVAVAGHSVCASDVGALGVSVHLSHESGDADDALEEAVRDPVSGDAPHMIS